MGIISENKVNDLIYLLKKQYPSNPIQTYAPCYECGKSSVGGGKCSDCIQTELCSLVDKSLVDDLVEAIKSVQRAIWHSYDVQEKIEESL